MATDPRVTVSIKTGRKATSARLTPEVLDRLETYARQQDVSASVDPDVLLDLIASARQSRALDVISERIKTEVAAARETTSTEAHTQVVDAVDWPTRTDVAPAEVPMNVTADKETPDV